MRTNHGEPIGIRFRYAYRSPRHGQRQMEQVRQPRHHSDVGGRHGFCVRPCRCRSASQAGGSSNLWLLRAATRPGGCHHLPSGKRVRLEDPAGVDRLAAGPGGGTQRRLPRFRPRRRRRADRRTDLSALPVRTGQCSTPCGARADGRSERRLALGHGGPGTSHHTELTSAVVVQSAQSGRPRIFTRRTAGNRRRMRTSQPDSLFRRNTQRPGPRPGQAPYSSRFTKRRNRAAYGHPDVGQQNIQPACAGLRLRHRIESGCARQAQKSDGRHRASRRIDGLYRHRSGLQEWKRLAACVAGSSARQPRPR